VDLTRDWKKWEGGKEQWKGIEGSGRGIVKWFSVLVKDSRKILLGSKTILFHRVMSCNVRISIYTSTPFSKSNPALST
jgi:hypothetical protein